MNTIEGHCVICIRIEGDADLEVRKVYRTIPDEAAARRRHLRVVDASGEDYLYPAEWFVAVEVSEEALATATASTTQTR